MSQRQFKTILKEPLEITPIAAKNTNSRKIRVTNKLNLDDLSNLSFQIAATVITQENTVLGLVDRALRLNGLVPSWVIQEAISVGNVIVPEAVFLNRIAGVETCLQLSHIKQDVPSYYLQDFTPAVYLMKKDGQIEPAVGRDLSKLNLADYAKLVVGVEFTPLPFSVDAIKDMWDKKYHKLLFGEVELTDVFGVDGRNLMGLSSLIGGLQEVTEEDISSGKYRLRNVHSKNGEKVNIDVPGDSFIAVLDRNLDGTPVFRIADTYLDGHVYHDSEVYLATLHGLERAFSKKHPIVDPRDIGILIQTEEQTPDGSIKRNLLRNGGVSAYEAKAVPGMEYDVVAVLQGVHDINDYNEH